MSTPGVNKVVLVGFLGFDPEIRKAQTGLVVANLRVATTERYKDKKSNEWKDLTEWHRVVAFGGLAEVSQKILQKGACAYIEGKLRTKTYEKDGVKRYSTEVVAQTIISLSRPPKTDEEYDKSWDETQTPKDASLPF